MAGWLHSPFWRNALDDGDADVVIPYMRAALALSCTIYGLRLYGRLLDREVALSFGRQLEDQLLPLMQSKPDFLQNLLSSRYR